jgi:hypothetical protein
MPTQATDFQKEFLQALGCSKRRMSTLSKQDASTLIDQLLASEKAAKKTFPCPYCGAPFGPRPKRSKTCPSCRQRIVHFSGHFYTEAQADDRQRHFILASVQADWKEERKTRRELGEPFHIGYTIHIEPSCPDSQHHHGTFVDMQDALKNPELLPPYKTCRRSRCACYIEDATEYDIPKPPSVSASVASLRHLLGYLSSWLLKR